MKKFIFVFLIIILSLYNCKKCSEAKPSSPNDCQGLELGEGESYCCYLRQKYHHYKYDNKHDVEYCKENNEENARKGAEIMKNLKQELINSGFIIDAWGYQCFSNSNFLFLSILSLILISFLF